MASLIKFTIKETEGTLQVCQVVCNIFLQCLSATLLNYSLMINSLTKWQRVVEQTLTYCMCACDFFPSIINLHFKRIYILVWLNNQCRFTFSRRGRRTIFAKKSNMSGNIDEWPVVLEMDRQTARIAVGQGPGQGS